MPSPSDRSTLAGQEESLHAVESEKRATYPPAKQSLTQ
jgi:hypothetical protein